MSDFTTWDQLQHAEDYVVFPDNIGEYLTIDETSLSQGELYTVVTNKAANGNLWRLYDLSKDIGETTNIAAAHPEVVEKMKSLLRRDGLIDIANQRHRQ